MHPFFLSPLLTVVPFLSTDPCATCRDVSSVFVIHMLICGKFHREEVKTTDLKSYQPLFQTYLLELLRFLVGILIVFFLSCQPSTSHKMFPVSLILSLNYSQQKYIIMLIKMHSLHKEELVLSLVHGEILKTIGEILLTFKQ